MTIRKAAPKEMDVYLTLRAASIRALAGSHYTPEQVEDWVQDCNESKIRLLFEEDRFFIGEFQGEIICGGTWLENEVAYLYVSPEVSRQGWGSRLLLHIESDYMRQTGHTSIDAGAANNARGFYEANGYEFIELMSGSNGHLPYTYSLLRKNLA